MRSAPSSAAVAAPHGFVGGSITWRSLVGYGTISYSITS